MRVVRGMMRIHPMGAGCVLTLAFFNFLSPPLEDDLFTKDTGYGFYTSHPPLISASATAMNVHFLFSASPHTLDLGP